MEKVFIVEDSVIIRGRIISMISTIKGVEICGVAGEPKEAINGIRESQPDAVILDLKLYGGSGIDVLQKIKEEKPDIKVIVLTNYPEPQYMKKCMDLGADYFFDKSEDFDKILYVIG
jgi:DNA-binding NarL/FixJ family response regulator